MYRLYRSPDDVRMTFSDFVDFADDLTDHRKYQGGGKYNARFPALPANKTRSGAHVLSVNLWSISFSRVLSPVFLPG